MKNIFFDACAIPVFAIILYSFSIRKLTRYRMFSMFNMMCILSILCAAIDIAMEFVVYPLPLSAFEVFVCTVLSFSYKFLRNASLVVFLTFVFSVTRTDYRIRPLPIRLILWAPNAVVILLLLLNFRTGWIFTVTAEGGYERGPLILVLYLVSATYGIAGIGYLIVCRKYLDRNGFFAILSVYLLTFLAVFIQLKWPDLMVEMFSTAIGILIVMFFVVRPEARMDSSIGVQTWKTFQTDLKNTVLTGQTFWVMALHIEHGSETREFLGDAVYYAYIREAVAAVEALLKEQGRYYELYCEVQGNLYAIIEGAEQTEVMRRTAGACLKCMRKSLKGTEDKGILFRSRACVIRCPEDVRRQEDIVNLCHRFPFLSDKRVALSWEIVNTRDFEIQNHIEDILQRAVEDQNLEIYYQPIYDVEAESFRSAEALARIHDDAYGMISPAVFIPAAERTGFIELLGKAVVESVYRFISSHDLVGLGLSFIEINLSVAQCIQPGLCDMIRDMQTKYGVDPHCVNFEITESMMESVDSVMTANLRKLSGMGYTLSLDDYGTGYSNVRRVRKLPLSLIKIDKSLVDDMFTEEGKVILKGTVEIMQGIDKQLVIEGVETKEELDALKSLQCEFIQGFYFSKPLPEEDFVRFLESHQAGRA